MASARPARAAEERPPTGVRRLTPENTTVFEGTFSLLHCAVKGDDLYRGVYAVMLFPISYPERYISLRYTDEEDRPREVGVIEDLNAFPPEAQRLVRASLRKHYFEKTILRVHDVHCEFGQLFFDVETPDGREQFVMPWRYDRAEDFGEKGKVLFDALDNRYVITDVNALPPADRRRFTSYIYW